MRTTTMPALSYRTSDGGCHRVLVTTVGGYPLVLDVADSDARLVDPPRAPRGGPGGAPPPAPAHGERAGRPPPRSPRTTAASAPSRSARCTAPPRRASRSRECAAAARSPPDAHVLNH